MAGGVQAIQAHVDPPIGKDGRQFRVAGFSNLQFIRFVQDEGFPFRRLPSSVRLAGIVRFFIENSERRLEHQHVTWLM